MEEAAEVRRENMRWGKAVAVDLMYRVRAPKTATEDDAGALGPSSVTP